MKNYGFTLRFSIIAAFSLGLLPARVLYVHPDSALHTIYQAFIMCQINDTILVGPGNYVQSISWPNKQGVHLLSEYGPETTITHGGIDFTYTYDTNTVVRGFTIRDGSTPWAGGGIYMQSGSAVIAGNIITDNRSGMYGGGIYLSGASPIIRGNVIRNNHSDDWGGGIALRDNANPVIINNIIENNTAASNGGGIFCLESAGLIRDNVVRLNSAAHTGGGINCWQSSPVIKNTMILRNLAADQGSGMYCWFSSPVIDSCTISSNNGDGIYCASASDPAIHNTNFYDNVGYGIINADSAVLVDARYNWWGDTSGPGGFGPGTGDEVSAYVDYYPWLNQPVSAVLERTESKPALSMHLWPNPFRDHVNIRWTMHKREGKNITIRIYDASGRLVYDALPLIPPLSTFFTWPGIDQQGRRVPAGVYFLKLAAETETFTASLILIK